MIHEIDQSLKVLITGQALADGSAEVVFDAPSRDWAARRNSPTIDAYLYDIREEVSRRERGAAAVRDPAGAVRARRLQPRWFRLSYLVTAWTREPEDEHRLLSMVLGCLLRNEILPPDTLPPSVAEITGTVPISVAVPAESRSIADIWSALGGELKPSLDVVVVTPFPVAPEFPVAPPVTEPAVVDVRDRGLDG
ncbi:DUF4255 domain-containing protein [Kineosporia sp. J2-2]|uniref:DUF4255 domain-containing protein n=1 Tax=Kineosporia corallincola TaxID=2835133 RepID=A0ABS5TQW6_9ACTN|nr:DUF4255 domain-containing protein [Kineosporia corallincola]MBT0772886.1 DUF4255 domain-containing protein [Kineosporia corallincola]